ncbi:MAG: DNA gyrase/topoisomerase IV subunit A [Bacteroidia bacterium]|nr:DNA gyrase/topoisomerase IV subunit A [Bacteroidia bacterium]
MAKKKPESKGKKKAKKGGEEEDGPNVPRPVNDKSGSVIHLSGMYENWFLDYASYVILERAVPHVNDGLKPVQRRILHSLNELEDGRYNKVANVIGNTMKYHPHGDASIGDAMVQIGQKDLLFDCQGNWGNILTGDSAAAPRYIEVRLSKFGQEVVFNPKTTVWLSSYDGRNKEPETLPVKFPLLLASGVEGIAVGLSCKILPHNFIELIDASISALKGRKPNILPDFPTGGLADFSAYNEGLRGGRIRVRARIRQEDKKTLVISEIPFGTTTGSLIESILSANDKGKIKVKKVEDNTAENVEVVIHLIPGTDIDKTIDALYAFTDCEVSIAPNAVVIENDKPVFLGVNEMLRRTAFRTQELLKQELEIKLNELQEDWHFSSLEKIFIEKRIYRDIENCETWDSVIQTIDKGLKPYKKKFLREITVEDITRLTEIKIKRISKFDAKKADEYMKGLEKGIADTKHNLKNLTDYTIEYYRELKNKYGKGRERRTEIKSFEVIEARQVIINNTKLYVNREEGFIGWSLRKDEFVCDCSELDEIVAFAGDGTMRVVKMADKVFMGKDIRHVAVFRRGEEKTVYHMVYRDGPKGITFMKRFTVGGVTRDKMYSLTRGTPGSEVLYFSANPNGESEVVSIILRAAPSLRKTEFDVDFGAMAVKGRDTIGNQVTKYTVRKVVMKEKGEGQIQKVKVWFDDTVHRLNNSEKGTYVGEFRPEDKILSINQRGDYRITGFETSIHFEDDIILIEKFDPRKAVTAVYYDADKKGYFVKRFIVELARDRVGFIPEGKDNALELATTQREPVVALSFRGQDKKKKLELSRFVEVMGVKAKGNRLHFDKIKGMDLLPAKGGADDPELEFEDSKLSPVQEAKAKSVKSKKGKGGQIELF